MPAVKLGIQFLEGDLNHLDHACPAVMWKRIDESFQFGE
jgi:hypothetical protein